MKTAVIILTVIGILTLNGCNQKTDSTAILDNPETRKELFNAIGENHVFMSEFMENMQNSQHAMLMMQENQKMMGNMTQGNGMQMMIKDSMTSKNMMQGMMGNPQMMKAMMGEMMKDGKMMGNMMQMMHQGGMMSADCMKSSIKMMEDKGAGMKGMDMKGMMNDNK
ncbi:DUF4175 domain-containing protein [Flavobacterium sp. K5-23]|uniref:DUF4175 domain-containing protein n=1 Tax=Flavobacterium sp. K5-23 TaxID=2746225 RepID=UPI00200BEA9F|nr:DUF4175 domain-containing protein [Flavobacterium sp. K5-23]UQD57021.1 hypothetical protein FLAK523_11740 [Flavobacterium sp. K5-23]